MGVWENVQTIQDARALIGEGVIPNERELSDIVGRLGRKSDVVGELCKTICEKIASATPKFVQVFAAYRPANKEKLYFVVWTEEQQLQSEIINTVCRKDFGLRDHEIVFPYDDKKEQYESGNLSLKEATDLENVVNKIARRYMDNYKYLSAIMGGKVDVPCIVMYVHPCTDRYYHVPYDEEPLPATIEGYKLVVRNGVFQLY